jgi:hypothetical protein
MARVTSICPVSRVFVLLVAWPFALRTCFHRLLHRLPTIAALFLTPTDVPQGPDNVSPSHLDLPSVPGAGSSTSAQGGFEWDDLERRFEALRQQK